MHYWTRNITGNHRDMQVSYIAFPGVIPTTRLATGATATTATTVSILCLHFNALTRAVTVLKQESHQLKEQRLK